MTTREDLREAAEKYSDKEWMKLDHMDEFTRDDIEIAHLAGACSMLPEIEALEKRNAGLEKLLLKTQAHLDESDDSDELWVQVNKALGADDGGGG